MKIRIRRVLSVLRRRDQLVEEVKRVLWMQRWPAEVHRNTVPMAGWLVFFALGAVLSAQTYGNVSAQAPPGTISTTIMSVMSWMMWIFGIVGACLLLWALATAAKHPGEGMWRVISGVVCLILCGSLFA